MSGFRFRNYSLACTAMAHRIRKPSVQEITYFDIILVYNRLGQESIASRVGVMLMKFSLTEVIMLGMFLLALLTYLHKRK